MEFLGHGRSAGDGAPLEHLHLQSRLGEIKGTYEAIVSGPDDQGIIASSH